MSEPIESNLRAAASASLLDADGKAIGIDILLTALAVPELGSLNAAARDAGHAYSAVHSAIRRAERAVGCELVESDGSRGSALTPAGKAVLYAVAGWRDSVAAFAARQWDGVVEPMVAAAAAGGGKPARRSRRVDPATLSVAELEALLADRKRLARAAC